MAPYRRASQGQAKPTKIIPGLQNIYFVHFLYGRWVTIVHVTPKHTERMVEIRNLACLLPMCAVHP